MWKEEIQTQTLAFQEDLYKNLQSHAADYAY